MSIALQAKNDLRRNKTDRRKINKPPCFCGHYQREHEYIWDPEAMKHFWFCNGCAREYKGYPITHHEPK